MSQSVAQLPSFSIDGPHTVVKVFLVNGESRSLRLDERTDVNGVIRFILHRLRVNMDVAPQLFGIQLVHQHGHESYWLQPGYTIQELLHEYCGMRPPEEWRFLLKIRVFPKTPQHLLTQDQVTFQYFFDQVLHTYLEDESIEVDNETAVKLGCLELRRFYKDMPQIALKKRENFTILEREIGLEKFFKQSLLNSVKRRNLRTMVQNTFQQYESLTMEGCVFQFFNLLSKYHAFDVERFTNCAVGDDQSLPLTCDIFVGPNCNVEYQPENGVRRFLAAFNDIQDISYEVELMSRGRVILDMTSSPPVFIRTAQQVTAVHLATLIDSYCMVYTTIPQSRMIGAVRKRFSNSSRYSSLYNTIDEVRFRPPFPDPYGTFRSEDFRATKPATAGDYAEVRESDASPVLGKAFSEHDVQLLDKIGEGQFGDVRKGLISPDTDDEQVVAIKTCKPDASHEERTKFLEEAAVMRKFNHPHIIKLFGVMSSRQMTYIIMELAPLGQLRRYLLTEGSRISKTTLLDYIHQLSSAMVHLESKNYVHRDIAARNVLVVTPQVVKLADFGLSRGLNDDADYYVASRGKLPIKWMAPESINFRRFTGLSDVWMFGVCCWEILMRGVKPFVGIKNDEVISKIELGERLPLPPDCPASLFRLMNSLWQYDPQDRPHFVEVEHTISEIVEEERQLTFMTQRRLYAGMQPTPNTPEKPPRSNPSSSSSLYQRVPSDPQVITREDEGNDVGDNNPLPLPPRVADRFREFSISPQPPDSISALGMDSDATGPPKPPRRMPRSVSGEHANRLSGGSQGNHFSGVDRELPFPPPPPIVPYSVTTITPIDPDIPTSHPSQRRSESPPMIMTLPIPPPPILHQPWRTENDSAGVYYSVPSDMSETGTSRVLSEHGTFVDQEMRTSTSYSSVESGRDGGGLRPRLGEGRPLSHASTEESSDRSSFVEERQDDFVPPEDDPVLQQTTVVVKAVMELSNKVPLSRPTDYVEFVKNVGLALRDLLSKVDEVLQDLPQQTHQEVSMAHKVLSSDMAHLVEAMKNAQKHHQTFLEQEYRKQMFQAAHIVAVNSKQLMDAVNSARRKAHLMQR